VAPTNLLDRHRAALAFNHTPATWSPPELQGKLQRLWLARTLADVCEVTPGEPLFEMAVARYRALAPHRRGPV